MALEEILRRIQSDTEREEKSIINSSEEEAKKVLDEARKRASLILADNETRAREDAETEKRQRISSATLEGRSYLEREREKIENDYLEELRSRIRDMRGSDEYLRYIKRVIDSARKVLGNDSLVYVGKGDADGVKKLGISQIKTSEEIDSLGGAIVTSADGRMIIDLTFSETLRNKNDEIRKIVRDYIKE